MKETAAAPPAPVSRTLGPEMPSVNGSLRPPSRDAGLCSHVRADAHMAVCLFVLHPPFRAGGHSEDRARSCGKTARAAGQRPQQRGMPPSYRRTSDFTEVGRQLEGRKGRTVRVVRDCPGVSTGGARRCDTPWAPRLMVGVSVARESASRCQPFSTPGRRAAAGKRSLALRPAPDRPRRPCAPRPAPRPCPPLRRSTSHRRAPSPQRTGRR